jgi:hypothetical protein
MIRRSWDLIVSYVKWNEIRSPHNVKPLFSPGLSYSTLDFLETLGGDVFQKR